MAQVRNITISVSHELYRQSRHLAADYDYTVTGLMRHFLENLPWLLRKIPPPPGSTRHPAMAPAAPAAPVPQPTTPALQPALAQSQPAAAPASRPAPAPQPAPARKSAAAKSKRPTASARKSASAKSRRRAA